MRKYFNLFFCALLTPFVLCSQNSTVDLKIGKQTKALFNNLKNMAGNGVLFGQQDALAYGIGWSGEYDRSDIKSVTGSHPAVFGWDLESVAKEDSEANLSRIAEKVKRYCVQVDNMGGVNTLSWHMQNFVAGKNFYDTTRCVTAILPGGAKHQDFVRALDKIAGLIKSLKTDEGIAIPIIFRPFHEHTGNWFWWGRPFCTANEYKQLWQFAVKYLRDKKHLHNVLYAYSPDRISGDFEQYIERYPGDDFVDVLGLDDYYEFKNINDTAAMDLAVKSLKKICTYAKARHKIAALTETGQKKIVQPKWFTAMFNKIMSDTTAARISYMLVWRNANTKHFFAPYPDHQSETNFKEFYNNPRTIFMNDLKTNLYQ